MDLILSSIDTWFFRDGTPFDHGGAPQEDVCSVFPPFPPTVVGAIRAALAQQNGWNGLSRWSNGMKEVLGDGPLDLGKLEITGPIVLCGDEPVFPLPRHVSVQFRETPIEDKEKNSQFYKHLLGLAEEEFHTDLGKTRLVDVAFKSTDSDSILPKSKVSLWVKRAGLTQVLNAQLPDDEYLIRPADIWTFEPRVGIARNQDTRTCGEKALYSTCHIRLRDNVKLGVQVEGVPNEWNLPLESAIPFGGENRLAWCAKWKNQSALQQLASSGNEQYSPAEEIAIVLLTPTLLGDNIRYGMKVGASECLQVLSVVSDRPLRVGGWNSLDRKPLLNRNVLRPGSVLFCKIEDLSVFQNQLKGRLIRLGDRISSGFGLCAVGKMPVIERST